MRFLKTFFRFCTITILCTTFTTVAWGYAWENLSTSPNCNHNTVLDCVAVTGCAYYPVANKCGESLCSNGTKAACNKKAGCIWMEQNCQVVPDGYFSPDGDKTLNGNTYDRAHHYGCPAGYYCKAGSGWPIICSAGTYSGANASSCTNCPAGTYRSSTGGTSASSCSNCAPGEYSNPGAAQCDKCPVGYYQNAGGQRQCNKCPDGTTTKNTGSTDSSQCIKKFNLKLYAEYQENGTTKQTLVSDSTHSFYAGDLNLFSGYTAQQVIGGKLGSAPLNNKWEYKPNTDKAYITVNGTNYNLAYNGTNWFWKSSNDMSILDTQANGSTFNLVFILTPKTYNVYMISSGIYNNSPMSMFSANTNAVATKNFGSTPADGVQPDQDKVQSCSFSASATATYYGYIASGTTPKYYECKRNSANFSLITNRSNGSTRMFEPASADNDICVGYDMTTCERGYSCNSCDRTACTTGTYQDATGQSSCKNCSTQTSNKYPSSAKGSDNINDCYVTTTAGKYVAEQGKGEVQCACGGYCVGGTVVYYSSGVGNTTGGRSTCGAGKYNSNTGSTTSDACKITSAGYYATTGSCNQTKVNAGCYGAAGSTSACPHNCPSDTGGRTVTSAQGSDTATDCYVSCGAKTISDGTASVVSSTINYNGTSYPACTYNTDCNAGYYGPDGVTDPSCSECADGKYSEGNATTCSNCPEGEESNADKTGCSGCAKGTYRTAEMTTCDSCPEGTYQDKTGQSSCKNCSAGKKTGVSGTGATSCTDCDAGTFSKDTANANCSPCPAGTYQDETGKPSCKSCKDGKLGATSSPNGIFTTTKGATAHEQCCFKSSLTLKDNVDSTTLTFSNVCWVGNGRSK